MWSSLLVNPTQDTFGANWPVNISSKGVSWLQSAMMRYGHPKALAP